MESSFAAWQGSTGAQEVHARTKSEYANYKIDMKLDHDMDSSGKSLDVQRVSYTGPDGKVYTDTHTWSYDPFTGETRETYRTEGEEPTDFPEPQDLPPTDGVAVSGKTNDDQVESKYGDRGVTDQWSSDGTIHWVDLDQGGSGHIDPPNQSALEVDSVPARTIPLICHIAGLAGNMPDLDTSPQRMINLATQGQEALDEFFDEIQKKVKMSASEKPLSVKVQEVQWKHPFRISGYPVAQYAVFVGNGKKMRKRADIWVVPRIDVWERLKGNHKNREKFIGDLLIPKWKGVGLAQQKAIFSKLAVMFLDHATGKYYFATSIKKLPDFEFQKPPIPAGYHVEHIDQKKLRNMGKEAEALFWQGMNP